MNTICLILFSFFHFNIFRSLWAYFEAFIVSVSSAIYPIIGSIEICFKVHYFLKFFFTRKVQLRLNEKTWLEGLKKRSDCFSSEWNLYAVGNREPIWIPVKMRVFAHILQGFQVQFSPPPPNLFFFLELENICQMHYVIFVRFPRKIRPTFNQNPTNIWPKFDQIQPKTS